jgi:tetratricopeptide (TPR) repeat protein
MHLNPLLWLAVALLVYFLIWGRKGSGPIARGIRTTTAMNAAVAAYRTGDYATALQKAGGLKDGSSKTPEYCFFRGAMLHHLGKLGEAEVSLREGLPLETDPHQRALVYNTLASVLMDQERYTEAIAFFENAGRAWPDRGANHRGIAEVWLRQEREPAEALDHARQAVEMIAVLRE